MSTHYFQKLNYTLANEDTRLEVALLPERSRHVAVIGGSGGRVLPLLARQPEKITVLDVSPEQLWLIELRLESARALSHAEFLGFWGYPPRIASPAEREAAFRRIRLSAAARAYLEHVFRERKWAPILYLGHWERTFQKLSKAVRLMVGRNVIRDFFRCATKAEHAAFLRDRFPRGRWKATLALLANAKIFNALLYRGSFPEKNFSGSFFEFYVAAFDRLFAQGPARENFFLQLCFFGELVYPEGLPIECDPVLFERAKKALDKTEILYRPGDAVANIAELNPPADFVSFSDVPSYFKGELEREFMQRIRSGVAPGSRVVIRNYVHSPEGTVFDGYRETTHEFAREIAAEKLQMYDVRVYEAVSK